MKIRFEFSKLGKARFLSHLDTARVFERAVRRSELPISYTQGFNPHPKIAFGPALPVGVAGKREYADMEFDRRIGVESTAAVLTEKMPSGFYVRKAVEISPDSAALSALIDYADYRVYCRFKDNITEAAIKRVISGYLKQEEIVVEKRTKKKTKNVDIRPGIFSLSGNSVGGNAAVFNMVLELSSSGNVKPMEVLESIDKFCQLPVEGRGVKILRKFLYAYRKGELLTPLNIVNA